MARCQITGKTSSVGNRVSHANNRTKHRQQTSVRTKRVWDDERGAWIKIKVTNRGLRMLNLMPLSKLRRKGIVQ